MGRNITAIIPCHNHEQWVSQAILSICKEEIEGLKFVVIDDASKDLSWNNILSLVYDPKELKTSISNLKVYSSNIRNFGNQIILLKNKENLGPSKSRNLGISALWDETDYFAFLDSDDYYMNGKIRKSLNIFEKYGDNIGVVYSDYDTLNEKTGFRQRQFKEPFCYKRLVAECIINNDSLVSKKALEKVGFYDEELRVCEDYDLWLRITEKFCAFHIPESLVTIRVGDHSSTDNVKKDIWQENYRKVINKFKNRNGK